MTSLPTTTNTTAQQADTIVKTIEGILVPIAENAIITAVPALGLPVVKQITEAIEQALADKLTALAETGVIFAVIDTETGIETYKLSDALKLLIAAEQTGDPSAIQAAIQVYQKAQSALVNDDGSAQAR